jgi:hypothetical protein
MFGEKTIWKIRLGGSGPVSETRPFRVPPEVTVISSYPQLEEFSNSSGPENPATIAHAINHRAHIA